MGDVTDDQVIDRVSTDRFNIEKFIWDHENGEVLVNRHRYWFSWAYRKMYLRADHFRSGYSLRFQGGERHNMDIISTKIRSADHTFHIWILISCNNMGQASHSFLTARLQPGQTGISSTAWSNASSSSVCWYSSSIFLSGEVSGKLISLARIKSLQRELREFSSRDHGIVYEFPVSPDD